MPTLAAKLIQKCLQPNPHLRPTAQELLNDEWFLSLGLVKRKPQDLKFKENMEGEGYVSERGIDERRDQPQRQFSQGRGVAEKIQSTMERSREKKLGGYSTSILASTSMGKFQTDTYSTSSKQSATNLANPMKEFKHSSTMNLTGSPTYDHKDMPSQTLQLRSQSRGRPEDDPQNHQKTFFNQGNVIQGYSHSVISSSQIPKKTSDGFSSPSDLSTQKPASHSQLGSYSNLPPKQLYPLLQNSQQSPVYEQQQTSSPQHAGVASPSQPLSLASTLKSGLNKPSGIAGDTSSQSFTPKNIHDLDLPDNLSPSPMSPAPGPRFPPTQDPLVPSLKAKITDLENTNSSLENKCSIMAKDLKDLRKQNDKLKAAIESLQSKDAVLEKMKREREKNEKEMEERMLDFNRIKEDYEALKNEVVEIARFIRSNLKPNWVVRSNNVA